MLKIRKSKRSVSPFSGISFVVNEIETAGIPQLIDSAFPKRHGKAKYGYADAILSLVYGTMCGSDRLDDYANLKTKVFDSELNIPSPVSLGRIMREKLSVSNVQVGNHKININDRLNSLLVDIAIELGHLKPGKSYVLDYDNTCIPCEKEDAEFTYKKFRGYQPGVCFIGEIPVYIEGMNGNNPAAFDQENTMERCLDILEEKGIGIRRFRADAASYSKGVITLMQERDIEIFIRAQNKLNMFEHIVDIFEWESVRLADDFFEVASFDYVPFSWDDDHNRSYRIVTTRRPSDDGKLHKITGKPFVYRSIITDNRELSDTDIVWTYNQRGAIELNFAVLNNDWNWNKLPFSFLSENTAFMLITAMGLVMYKYVVETFADRVDFVEETDRLKRFRYNVISVAGEWRNDTLLLFDNSQPWEKLAG